MPKKIVSNNNNNIFKILTFVLGGLFIISISYCIYLKINYSKQNTVTVTGKAYSNVENKIASFTATVEVSNSDKQTAVNQVTERSAQIVSAIKELGLDPKDVETTSLNLWQREEPVYENGVTKYEPGDWYASYSVEVTLRELDKTSEVTNILTSFENTSLWGPNLRIEETDIDEEALLSEAIEDARQKASAIAMSSGKKLGKVVNVSETEAYSPYLMREASMLMDGYGGGDMPIESGSTKTSKSVTVTFKLR